VSIVDKLIARREDNARRAEREADRQRAAADLLRQPGTGRVAQLLAANRESEAARLQREADRNRTAADLLRSRR
jgi:hypothetical protein